MSVAVFRHVGHYFSKCEGATNCHGDMEANVINDWDLRVYSAVTLLAVIHCCTLLVGNEHAIRGILCVQ